MFLYFLYPVFSVDSALEHDLVHRDDHQTRVIYNDKYIFIHHFVVVTLFQWDFYNNIRLRKQKRLVLKHYLSSTYYIYIISRFACISLNTKTYFQYIYLNVCPLLCSVYAWRFLCFRNSVEGFWLLSIFFLSLFTSDPRQLRARHADTLYFKTMTSVCY